MANLPKMVSHFDQELMLSLEIPEGWQFGRTDQFLRLYMAPSENNYQANLGMNVNRANDPSPETLDKLLQDADQQRKSQDRTYKQTNYQKLTIDNNPARIRLYEWTYSEQNLTFSQIQALILKAPLILIIDGSSLKQLESKYIPVFEYMVKSIRFIEKK